MIVKSCGPSFPALLRSLLAMIVAASAIGVALVTLLGPQQRGVRLRRGWEPDHLSNQTVFSQQCLDKGATDRDKVAFSFLSNITEMFLIQNSVWCYCSQKLACALSRRGEDR